VAERPTLSREDEVNAIGVCAAHAAIAARAYYEHAAIMRGDDMTGLFGRYQPATLRRVHVYYLAG
jgi:hypothetical protein